MQIMTTRILRSKAEWNAAIPLVPWDHKEYCFRFHYNTNQEIDPLATTKPSTFSKECYFSSLMMEGEKETETSHIVHVGWLATHPDSCKIDLLLLLFQSRQSFVPLSTVCNKHGSWLEPGKPHQLGRRKTACGGEGGQASRVNEKKKKTKPLGGERV